MPENHNCNPWPCEDCLLDEFTCRACGGTYIMKDGPRLQISETIVGPFGAHVYLTACCRDCFVKGSFFGD